MPSLDWAKIKVATLMIGCEAGGINGKLTLCLHDRYFDRFGGPAAWIESVTAECREKRAPPTLRWKAQNVRAWKSGDKSPVPRTRLGRCRGRSRRELYGHGRVTLAGKGYDNNLAISAMGTNNLWRPSTRNLKR